MTTTRNELPRRQILVGDAATMLATLPSQSIDCVVTSPPYFLLRNYAVNNQIGQEHTVDAYVSDLVAVIDRVARLLKPTGSLWLNLGDSYSRHERYGAPTKSLLLAPERVLLTLATRGWLVRNKVIWAKPNPMPASVRDRLTCTWEPLYLLVRSPRYFFDLDAIREPHKSQRKPAVRPIAPGKYDAGKRPTWAGPLAGSNDGLLKIRAAGRSGHPLGKNPGDVWTLATARYRGAHFATFPTHLLTKPLLATCPERVCVACGTPWQGHRKTIAAACACASTWQPGVVLDPFMGAGTTAVEAERLGRDWIGIELNPDYAALARERIHAAGTATHKQQQGGSNERTTNTNRTPRQRGNARRPRSAGRGATHLRGIPVGLQRGTSVRRMDQRRSETRRHPARHRRHARALTGANRRRVGHP